jgi:hypothetical protein
LRRAYFLAAMLFTAVLCLSGIGVAAAEPQKNQIVVEADCPPQWPKLHLRDQRNEQNRTCYLQH